MKKISGIVAEMSGHGNLQKKVHQVFGGCLGSLSDSKSDQSLTFVVSAYFPLRQEANKKQPLFVLDTNYDLTIHF
ncbi:MAG: hypothetical protein PHR66_11080 [Desulfuromonadaceae bacterium]|nr:hypothetical protein [Desulfuromonadaceae bacterium]